MAKYKYGERVMVGGKDVGEARFDDVTGKPLAKLQEDNTSSETSGSDSFLSSIQKALLGQSGIISSQDNLINSGINKAIRGVKDSTRFSNEALESKYLREKDFAEMKAGTDIQTFLEGRSGFATQMVAFRNLVETTDKNLKDLAMRKEELILQNNAEAASKVSELEMKALEFKQEASRSYFSNLLGMANFGLNLKESEDRKKELEQSRLDKEKDRTYTETKDMTELIQNNPQAGILSTDTMEQAQAKIAANPNSPDILYKKAQIDNIRNEILNRNKGGGKVSMTEAERLAATLSAYAGKFQPGQGMSDGTPTIDENGFATPKAFKKAIGEAKVTRKAFIEQLGYLVYRDKDGKVSDSYGLTPQEKKLIESS